MTVDQLIKALKAFPKNMVVEVYQQEHKALEEACEVLMVRYPKEMCQDGEPQKVVVIR